MICSNKPFIHLVIIVVFNVPKMLVGKRIIPAFSWQASLCMKQILIVENMIEYLLLTLPFLFRLTETLSAGKSNGLDGKKNNQNLTFVLIHGWISAPCAMNFCHTKPVATEQKGPKTKVIHMYSSRKWTLVKIFIIRRIFGTSKTFKVNFSFIFDVF